MASGSPMARYTTKLNQVNVKIWAASARGDSSAEAGMSQAGAPPGEACRRRTGRNLRSKGAKFQYNGAREVGGRRGHYVRNPGRRLKSWRRTFISRTSDAVQRGLTAKP